MKKLKTFLQTLSALLAALKLSLIGLQHFLPGPCEFFVKEILPLFQPDELQQVSELIQQDEWTAWLWNAVEFLLSRLWDHCVLLAICLLVIPPLAVKFGSSFWELLIEGKLILANLFRRLGDEINRSRITPVDLKGKEYVLVEYQNGREQIYDIMAARYLSSGKNFSIRREDNGETLVSDGNGNNYMLHDREPFFPSQVSPFNEQFKQVYRITLFVGEGNVKTKKRKRIAVGENLCFKCGRIGTSFQRTSSKAAVRYVPDTTLPISFSLKQSGNRVQISTVYAPEGWDATVELSDPFLRVDERGCCPESFRISLSYTSENGSGVFEDIPVSERDRVCPFCQNRQYYSPLSGRYNTSICCEIGRPGVGKTQFLKAIQTNKYLDYLDAMLSDDFSIIPLPSEERGVGGDERVAAFPTPLGGGKSFCILIQKNRGESAELIYILDVAGEFILDGNGDQNRTDANRALLRKLIQTYVSAVFVLFDPRDLSCQELSAYKEARQEYDKKHHFIEDSRNPLPVLKLILNGALPPMAVILTGADTLAESSDKSGGFLTLGDQRVFSSRGLLRDPDGQIDYNLLTAERLRKHMVLSKILCQRLGIAAREKGAAYFCTSSGKVNLTDGAVDSSLCQWVSDPLAWVLSQIGLAQVRE